MNRHIRILAAAAALLAGSAAEAGAQFTGVVTPPPKREQTAARSDSANRQVAVARDSANRTRLTDMKTWVDSATVALAGNTSAAVAAVDTSATDSTHTGHAVGRRRHGGDATVAAAPDTMRDGARAPNTATPLPTLAVVGTFGLGAGLVLMGRRRRA